MVQMSIRQSSFHWATEWVSCTSVNGLQTLVADVSTGDFSVDELNATIELPSGPSYLIQTPVVIRLEDGVITCIADGSGSDEDAEQCIYGPLND